MLPFKRPPGGGFEIEFLDLIAVENDDPGLLRVTGIDKHALGHEILRDRRAAGRARG